MKKFIIIISAMILGIASASAQKYALIDMEYILKNIPAYEMANEQLNQVAKRWQKECDDLTKEAETLFKNYQADMVFLTDEMKQQRADEVKAKEQEVMELRRKYFGPEGELYKKRESLMTPIQDEIYNAVKELADAKGYSLILDRASDASIIFASPRIDISNEVLSKLGYSE